MPNAKRASAQPLKHLHGTTSRVRVPVGEEEILKLKVYLEKHPSTPLTSQISTDLGITQHRVGILRHQLHIRWLFRKPRPWDKNQLTRYQKYLKGDHWSDVRHEVALRSNGLCQRCGVRPMRDVHHKTYEHIGLEDFHLYDLEALCRECHQSEHGI